MNTHRKLVLGGFLAVSAFMAACEKKVDPFVDRVVAPVLVLVEGAPDGGGQTAEPVVSQKVSSPVVMSARILDLDKSGILDYKVGIDSIPVASLAIKLTKRDGTLLANLTTDAGGRVSLTKTWAELGIAAPKSGNTVLLTWTGEYKGQAFSRLSRIQATN